MKTLHYVLHMAVLLAFVIFAVTFGMLTVDKQSLSDVAAYGVSSKALTHDHMPVQVSAVSSHDCRICLELGLSTCVGAMPAYKHQSATQKGEPEVGHTVPFKVTLAIWFNSIFPKNDRANGARQMETESLLSYANWE